MEEVEGDSLFLVIFLIVFVCALSCGLLWFICTRFLEDACKSFCMEIGDGFRHLSSIANRKQIANAQMLGAPTKIIVTKPPKEANKEEGSQILPTAEEERKSASFRGRLQSLKTKWRDSPDEKIIYSCKNTPMPSPATTKHFFWSKSKNFDYFQNTSLDETSHVEKKQNDIFLTKISERPDPEAGPIPIDCNTPLSLFHNHPTIIRSTSAPLRPRSGFDNERVLHM